MRLSDDPAGSREPPLELTAVSYNIHSSRGRDGRLEPARIAEVVAATRGDIVGLQEVDARLGTQGAIDQFAYFAEQLGMHSIAGPNILEHRGHYGNVLLTAWPVEESRLIKLAVGGLEPRGAICAVLRCGAHRLQVINTHLGLRRAERRQQARILLEAASRHEGPTLFLGDFNDWRRQSPTLRSLGAPTNAAHTPRTFPSGRPLFALDRIWTTPLAYLDSVRAVQTELTRVASDHLPVVGLLRLGTPLTSALSHEAASR